MRKHQFKPLRKTVIHLLIILTGMAGLSSLTSCEQPGDQYATEIKGLDSMHTALLAAQQQLEDFDTARYLETFRTFKATVKHFPDSVLDMVEREDGMFISRYRRLKKGFKKFDEKLRNYGNEIQTSLEKTETLKSDLSKGVVATPETSNPDDTRATMTDAERATLYYRDEMETGTKLILEMQTWLEGVISILDLFDELNPKAQEIVEQLTTNTDA